MSAVADDELLPRPGDEEHVTRGEWRRMNTVQIMRLERIEGLCFDDAPNRPSLETLITKVDHHINVTCAWARWLKWTIVGIGALATAILAILKLLREFPGLWPW